MKLKATFGLMGLVVYMIWISAGMPLPMDGGESIWIKKANAHDPNILQFISSEMHQTLHDNEYKRDAVRDFAVNTWFEPNEPIKPVQVLITLRWQDLPTCIDFDDDPLYWGMKQRGRDLIQHSLYFIKGDSTRCYILWDRSLKPYYYERDQARTGFYLDVCCSDFEDGSCIKSKMLNPQPKLRPKNFKEFADLHKQLNP